MSRVTYFVSSGVILAAEGAGVDILLVFSIFLGWGEGFKGVGFGVGNSSWQSP